MSLSARLNQGYLSIYGTISLTGISSGTPNPIYQFGLIDQKWDSQPGTTSVGETVMFKTSDSLAVIYQGTQYLLIPEEKIILIEQIGGK
jgi:hypothetical protein